MKTHTEYQVVCDKKLFHNCNGHTDTQTNVTPFKERGGGFLRRTFKTIDDAKRELQDAIQKCAVYDENSQKDNTRFGIKYTQYNFRIIYRIVSEWETL